MLGQKIITVIYYFTNNRNGSRNEEILFSEHYNGSENSKKKILQTWDNLHQLCITVSNKLQC